MKIDITLEITQAISEEAQKNHGRLKLGHFGTHFDVMNKKFPLDYVERQGIFFDISKIWDRDVEISDIDINAVQKDMFVGFYSGFVEAKGYGTKEYFGIHPCLSNQLVDALLDKEISIIGLDFSGVRNGKEHNPMDQYCADRGVFIVENLCNMKAVMDAGGRGTVYTFPIKYSDLTGLPCRVVVTI